MFRLIQNWYFENARDLPWRNTKNPYKIWLSEIILQQTRVDQGLSYYNNFISSFPKIQDLAFASQDQVLLKWQGLGYYNRARNLHWAAKTIVNDHKGIFPESVEELKKLKGVGDYTAAAIASFAFGFPVAVVDGNVYRVLSRFFGDDTPIDTTKGKKNFNNLANHVLDKENPATHNQAMMELGATVCTPKLPKCTKCPLNNGCAAQQAGKIMQYPVKLGKTKQRYRYFYYMVILNEKKVYIERRIAKDIWEGLFQFPLLESYKRLSDKEIIGSIREHKLLKGAGYIVKSLTPEKKHILSHQVLFTRYIIIHMNGNLNDRFKQQIEVSLRNLDDFAMPRSITRFLEENVIK